MDDNLPPIRWKLGRIHNVHRGDDGVVRVETLKTASGVLETPGGEDKPVTTSR